MRIETPTATCAEEAAGIARITVASKSQHRIRIFIGLTPSRDITQAAELSSILIGIIQARISISGAVCAYGNRYEMADLRVTKLLICRWIFGGQTGHRVHAAKSGADFEAFLERVIGKR